MKHIILCFLFVFVAQNCTEQQTSVNLSIYVADAETKMMLPDAEIGNYGLNTKGNKVFIKEGTTNNNGYLKLLIKHTKKPQEPFVFHYVVKKIEYITDTINYNNHSFTSSNKNEVTLDTIYLKRQ